MNKQVFTVEIILPPDTSRVSELRLAEAIRKGYKEHFAQEIVNLFVSENSVEQNVERPNQEACAFNEIAIEPFELFEKHGDAFDYLDDRFQDLHD